MKLSIIVPVYNVEKYLEKCIQSLINQTLDDAYEIILVNDGSTDDSRQIIEKYKAHSSIKCVDKKNGGLSDARNTGLKIAKGEFIGFVDSDDFIDSNMYKVMLHKIKEDKSDMVICGISRVNENNKEIRGYIPKNNTFKEVLNNAYACNKLYKRELFENIEFPIGKHYEDIFTVPQIFLKAKNISIVKQKFYYYLHRDGAITTTKDNEKIINIIEAYIELKKIISSDSNQIDSGSKEDFQMALVQMKNKFMLRTISGYSIKYFNENQEKIIQNFKELGIWELQDYARLYISKYFPKNYIKKILKLWK